MSCGPVEAVYKDGRVHMQFSKCARKLSKRRVARSGSTAEGSDQVTAGSTFPNSGAWDQKSIMPPALKGVDFGALGKLGFSCTRVGKLDKERRKQLPSSAFGMPETRSYPMPDPKHAANAKSRAKVQLKRGRLSKANYSRIIRKANKIIAACSRH